MPPTPRTGDAGIEFSRSAASRVLGYIDVARKSDAGLVSGGERPAGQDRGWFVEPTAFADVKNSDRLAREEHFGPVMAVIPFDDDGAPFGGMKNSGIGPELGPDAINPFLEYKSIYASADQLKG
jgi:aldehyde dehydrogenase (NAD+)